MTTGVTYQPLTGDNVRLLRLEPSISGGLPQCTLVYASLDECPYYALSYVWGDIRKQSPILVNGYEFSVTTNLAVLLQHLSKWQQTGQVIRRHISLSYTSLFWIDAICIDQSNLDEKSVQIPRMGDIYRAASQVLCWLGPNSNLEETTNIKDVFAEADDLEDLYQHPEFGIAAFPSYAKYLEEKKGGDMETICEALLDVIRRPWFTRLWVLQEVILAREQAILLAGDASTTLHNLYLLWATMNMYVKDGLIRARLKSGVQIGHFESTRLGVQSDTWMEEAKDSPHGGFASRLYELLDRTGGILQSCLPHDMIYGLLGMTGLPGDLPVELKPNYSAPWPEVYEKYARLLLESTGNLSLLSSVRKNMSGVPSWVPDFREKRFGATGLRSKPLTTASITFPATDPRTLSVEGVQLSTVVATYQAPVECVSDVEQLGSALPNFSQAIIARASSITGTSPEVVLRSWLAFLLQSSHFQAFHAIEEDFYGLYHQLANDDEGNSQHTYSDRITQGDLFAMADLLQTSLCTLTHFVTTDGMIGILMREDDSAQEGDCVCVFKGSIYASLIRPKGSECFFIGGCRLNDGIDDHTDAAQAYGQDFFENRATRSFLLI